MHWLRVEITLPIVTHQDAKKYQRDNSWGMKVKLCQKESQITTNECKKDALQMTPDQFFYLRDNQQTHDRSNDYPSKGKDYKV